MDYTNLPKITVVEIKELENGDANVVFDYDDLFVEFAQKELKLETAPTEEQLGQFIYDLLVKSLEKTDGWDLAAPDKNPELKDVD